MKREREEGREKWEGGERGRKEYEERCKEE